jgi:hypothetical protein
MPPTTKGRKLLILGAAVVLMALPGFVLTALHMEDFLSMWTLGSIAGFIAVFAGGWRVAVAVFATLTVLTPLATASVDAPWAAAAILALTTAAASYSTRWGLEPGTSFVSIPLAFAIANPPDLGHPPTAADLWLMALVSAISVLWGIGMAAAGGLRGPTKPPPRLGPQHAAAFAAIKGLAVGATTWFVVDLHIGHAGAWMIMTLVIIVRPTIGDTWTRTLQRSAGTLAGFMVALLVGLVFPWPLVAYTVGTLLMVVALVERAKGQPYWRYVALLTPAVVLMEGADGNVVTTDIERLVATFVGAAVALAVIAILWPFRTAVRPATAPAEATATPPE